MRSLIHCAVALAAILLLSCSVPAARAQSAEVRYDPIAKTLDLDADHASIRLVVQKLVSSAGITRFRMDPDIDGPVTLSLRNKPFNFALQTALARAGAEFDYIGNELRIYRVGNRPETGGQSMENWRRRGEIPRAFLQHVGLQANNQTLATVMGSLNRQTGVRLTTTQETPRDLKITAVAGDEALWNVLQRIAQASRLKVDITGDHEAVFSPLTSIRTRDRNGEVGHSGETSICRHCRYELKREWKFCPMCGERIDR